MNERRERGGERMVLSNDCELVDKSFSISLIERRLSLLQSVYHLPPPPFEVFYMFVDIG